MRSTSALDSFIKCLSQSAVEELPVFSPNGSSVKSGHLASDELAVGYVVNLQVDGRVVFATEAQVVLKVNISPGTPGQTTEVTITVGVYVGSVYVQPAAERESASGIGCNTDSQTEGEDVRSISFEVVRSVKWRRSIEGFTVYFIHHEP